MNLLFLGTPEDKSYLFRLKEAIGPNHACRATLTRADTLSEVAMLARQAGGAKYVITTQQQLIPKLCDTASAKEQTVQNYAGSWLVDEKNGITYLVVPPLKQCITLEYGQFLLERYVSKITKPGKWLVTDEFSWKLCSLGSDYEEAHSKMLRNDTLFTTVDIETRRDLSISSISYTVVSRTHAAIVTLTYVVPLPNGLTVEEYEYRFAWIRKLNATPAPKLLQNGKYDIAYLNRYGCPLVAYLFDTAVCHHAWYSELKKDLGTLAAFYIKKACYWKNEGDSGNEYDLYRYNALDTWNTTWVFLAWLHEAPAWAMENYKQEFPVLIPAVLCEATGIQVDMEKFTKIKAKQEAIVEQERASLGRNLATPNFNPGSPKQVGQMMKIIGCGDLKGTEEKVLLKAAYRHPYNQWLIDKILGYRKAAKLVSTYLNADKFFTGQGKTIRVLYSLTPYGTKTARLASESHAFWCGMQIQNIPRSGGIKSYMIADEGFLLGEADYAQAESRYTGFITGDTVLIDAVTGENDFHSFNASAFFGIPYPEICTNLPDGSHKILDKEIRQLSKPVNHGKNYNMGDGVLVDTMGLVNIFKAARRLGLPKAYGALQIAAYLGKCFAATYKIVTGVYPNWIKQQVESVQMLRSATGWTRYCFGKPSKDKRALNAYIAHPPQNLNAMVLNKAFVKVFYEVWMPNQKDFKLCAQIHDSILFQNRQGREDLAHEVARCMEEASSISVTDIGGITRSMMVPVDLSIGGTSWQDSKEH